MDKLLPQEESSFVSRDAGLAIIVAPINLRHADIANTLIKLKISIQDSDDISNKEMYVWAKNGVKIML